MHKVHNTHAFSCIVESSLLHRIPAVSYTAPLCACRQLDCRDRELTSKRSNVHQLSRQQADLIRATEQTVRRLTDIQDSIGQADDEVILEAATFFLAAAVRHKARLHSSKGSAMQ